MNERQFNFWLIVVPIVLLFWLYFMAPKPVPPKPKDPVAQQKDHLKEDGTTDPNQPGDTKKPVDVKPPKDIKEPPVYPAELVMLGSADPESDYFIEVELNTQAASINSVTLNGKNYPQRADRSKQYQILQPVESLEKESPYIPKTFAIEMKAINSQLKAFHRSFRKENWQIDKSKKTDSQVTFFYVSPDQAIRLEKTYSLEKIDLTQQKGNEREVNPKGYTIALDFKVINLSDKEKTFSYVLEGPAGLTMEDVVGSYRFREIQIGTLQSDQTVLYNNTTALELSSQYKKRAETLDPSAVESYNTPIKFLGVDTQYFTAIVIPVENQATDRTIKEARPKIVGVDLEKKSNLTVFFDSVDFSIKPHESVSHRYNLYAGPKRSSLLKPIGIEESMNWGWFGMISKFLLGLMGFFHHSLGAPYWLAIIMLTVIVRSCMYPISYKVAVSSKRMAKKMKAIQPEIDALKKKYENDKEKLGLAQMELMRKRGANPLAGCLPFPLLFLQLPIFYGLYTGLRYSVDLRMAQFLWIDDLASQDALFQFPFPIWFLGENFNLLPIITAGLMFVQQKLFAPPATTDEQAQAQKMMMRMMPIMMLFIFYSVQAGLCLYFIASSLWSVVERTLIDKQEKKREEREAKAKADGTFVEPENAKANASTKNNATAEPEEEKKPGLFSSIMKTLDAAANPQDQHGKRFEASDKKNKKKKNKKKKK